MTRNTIGILQIALEIASAKANGCDGGDCTCGEGELPFAVDDLDGGDCTCGECELWRRALESSSLAPDDDCLGGCCCGECELPLAPDDDCLAKGWEAFQPAQPEQPTQPQKPIL